MNDFLAAASTATGHSILVAEDDPDVRMLISAFLGGIRPMIEACDGREALEMIRRHRPALIVCDSEMPKMRARDVIAAMRADPDIAGIPIIVTSGYPEPEVLDCDTPADAFLQKPFTATELIRLAERFLHPAVA